MKPLTVTTDVGTFTRRTARTYTHIVLVKDVRAEVLAADRFQELTSTHRELNAYRAGTGTDGRPLDPKWIESGKVAGWITDLEAKLAQLEAQGNITQDQPTDWTVYAWCGRRDLADKQFETEQLARYRHVRLYDVATGDCFRTRSHPVVTVHTIELHRAERHQARLRRHRMPRGWRYVHTSVI